ncbi:MAG TPA: AzlC family ABC transporter permease [Nocardioides sp.]|jgi:predicted branched-subunit amino acid permease|nr:AzlC family ABC transporter permease [Nocardioides sp.]
MERTETLAPSGTAHVHAGVRREALHGVATMLPLVLGYVPFALLIGVAAGGSPDPGAAWAGSLLIFGGSAHLSVIEMVGHGSGLAAAVGSGLLINARLAVYSAAMLPLWRGAPLRQRLLAAAAVIDPMWLVSSQREARPGTTEDRRAFYAGAAATLAVGWSTTMGVGVLLGAQHESTGSLGVFTPLCLAAIVAPHLRNPAGARCVAAAGAVAAVSSSWPSGTGLLAAMAAGATAGTWSPRQVAS